MADHICKPGFCITCHCRRIAAEREAAPGYRSRHQKGLNRWADARVGVEIQDAERPMIPELRRKGFSARTARLVIVRSRPGVQQQQGGDS